MNPKGSSRAGKRRASQSQSSLSDQQPPSPPAEASSYAPAASLPQTCPSSKVAIPRLRFDSQGRSVTLGFPPAEKNRVSHACEPCRQRKTKCSGEHPRCQHCEVFNLPCTYADGKRDRTKRQLGSLADRLEEYEQLLEEISSRVGDQDRVLIRRTLDRDFSPEAVGDQTSSSGPRSGFFREPAGEYKAQARAGSTESLDRVDEDYSRNSATRATGYYGKNSEVTWMQRLKRLAIQDSEEEDEDTSDDQRDWLPDVPTSPIPRNDEHASGSIPVNESSYHLDDLALTLPDDVDPFEVPPRVTANLLLQSYLQTVHPAFPIIGKTTFLSQYKAYQLSQDHSKINHSWLAILNLIFAIGAKYSHLIQAEWSGDKQDHLVYFTRARTLGFNSEAILGHADLQKVQIAGLISFYLMALNQINRSWAISGIAIRHASTLALNLRNSSKDIPETSKEIRYRVWWALCSLERLLAVMTGRLPSFSDSDCTAPTPLPLEEESFFGDNAPSQQTLLLFRRWPGRELSQTDGAISTPSSTGYSSQHKISPTDSISPTPQLVPPCNALYFQHFTKLSTFSLDVLHRLYRANVMSRSWADVLAAIATLNSKLEKWRAELPSVFDFTKKQRDQDFVRQRMSLGFSYYSIVTIITRPCLCRMDRKIPDQSGKANISNRENAKKCVHAARDMLEMLPTEPNAVGLCKVAPWWCLVHYLTQAATVLTLELTFRADHMPLEAGEIFESAIKAVDWLRSLSEEDEAAKRAWSLCEGLLRKVAPRIGRNLNEALEDGDDRYHSGQATSEASDIQAADMDTTEFTQVPATSFPPQHGLPLAPFPPSLFSYYDQYLPYGQMPATCAASGPYHEPYATASEMDVSQYDGRDYIGYIEQDHQHWFHGGGGGRVG